MIDEEFKEKIITTKFKNYLPVLKYLKNIPRSSQVDTQKAVNYSAGKIYRVVKDAKLLNLIHNGVGLSLTELGEEWIKEYETKSTLSFELKKKACLNVPIFVKTFEEKKDVTSVFELRDFFRTIAPPEIEDKKIGSALRRYLEGMYNIKISESKMRMLSEKKQVRLTNLDVEKPQQKTVSYDKLIHISEKLNDLEKEYSIEEINAVLKIRHPEL